MNIENFTPVLAVSGGLIIGLAAVVMMLFNGKIAGISGITKGMLSKNCASPAERQWRQSFIGGLILGGTGIVLFFPQVTAAVLTLSPLQMLAGGLLVGFGTALGNGCTSGHGVCGLARRSPRSLASVMTFMAAGFVTMFVMTQILAGGRF